MTGKKGKAAQDWYLKLYNTIQRDLGIYKDRKDNALRRMNRAEQEAETLDGFISEFEALLDDMPDPKYLHTTVWKEPK